MSESSPSDSPRPPSQPASPRDTNSPTQPTPSQGETPSPDLQLTAFAEPIPGYVLHTRLGKGGFGEVWRANASGGVAVAMKFIPLGDKAGEVEQRSLDLMVNLHHPNLVGLSGAWKHHGYLVLAMELADRTLLDRLNECRGRGLPGIPLEEVLEYLREAAKGLDYLNGEKIQHRDVKPQNLLLVGGGVKVADFGLAKVLQHSLTDTTHGGFTLAYAAPELLNNQVSYRTDQYCLAVSYCQLRGGQLPFNGPPTSVAMGHLMHPPDLSMLPERERAVVGRALAKKPEDRWGSCREFVERLAEAATARVPGPEQTPPSRGRRRFAGVTALVLALAGLVAGAAWLLTREGRPSAKEEARVVDTPPEPRLLIQRRAPDAVTLQPGGAQRLDVTLDRTEPVAKFENRVGMTMVLLQAGSFQMGSPESPLGGPPIPTNPLQSGPPGSQMAIPGEKPQHKATIPRPFYLAAHAVTVGQFRRFVEDKEYHAGEAYRTESERDGRGGKGYDKEAKLGAGRGAKYTWRNTGWSQTDEHPVVNVSWNDAVAYCAWLGKKEGRSYGLPTEAEWEYACRAGTTSRYWCGDAEKSLEGNENILDSSSPLLALLPRVRSAKDWDDGYPFTAPVGKFKPNPWGLYDMHGNVNQWCADGPREYKGDYVDDTENIKDDEYRLLRGGSWRSSPRACPAARRLAGMPGHRDNSIGFRVASRLPTGTPGPAVPKRIGDE